MTPVLCGTIGTSTTASFFGATAIDRGGLSAPSVGALVVLGLSVLAGVNVLLPHRMRFVLDVRDVHRELYDAAGEDVGAIQTRVAYPFQDFRSANKARVDRLFQVLAAGTALLVIQVVLWSWALAIA